jgi:hypothetical protein
MPIGADLAPGETDSRRVESSQPKKEPSETPEQQVPFEPFLNGDR